MKPPQAVTLFTKLPQEGFPGILLLAPGPMQLCGAKCRWAWSRRWVDSRAAQCSRFNRVAKRPLCPIPPRRDLSCFVSTSSLFSSRLCCALVHVHTIKSASPFRLSLSETVTHFIFPCVFLVQSLPRLYYLGSLILTVVLHYHSL